MLSTPLEQKVEEENPHNIRKSKQKDTHTEKHTGAGVANGNHTP